MNKSEIGSVEWLNRTNRAIARRMRESIRLKKNAKALVAKAALSSPNSVLMIDTTRQLGHLKGIFNGTNFKEKFLVGGIYEVTNRLNKMGWHGNWPAENLTTDVLRRVLLMGTQGTGGIYTERMAYNYTLDQRRVAQRPNHRTAFILKEWEELHRAGVFMIWKTRKRTYFAPFPTFTTDAQGRLHGETGPAASWMGHNLYYWHGVRVESWFLAKDKITKDLILNQGNTELRRCLCEIIGWDAAIKLLDGIVIDEDECLGLKRKLYRVNMARGSSSGRVHLLKVVNGTIEDGVRREFVEVIPSEINNCASAMAWQIGVSVHLYNEGVRT